MKHTLLFLAALLYIQAVCAQVYQSETIAINNFSSQFFSNGVAAEADGGFAHFNVPKDSQTTALYAAALWVGGYDAGNNLHVSSIRYDDSITNFRPGPIATSYAGNYMQRYDRVWKVNLQQIDYHRQHYSDVAYTPATAITEWPGNGNVANGEPAVTAPFADLNGNLVYEPQLGEYPIIRGDEALYMIYSDHSNISTTQVGVPLGIDVHLMVYAYTDGPSSALGNSLFLNYNVINRSGNSYHDVLVGKWSDFDLGSYANDRVGCDTTLNSFFVYNGTSPDVSTQGLQGYGFKQAALGVKMLNHELYSFAYFTNGAVLAQNDPTTATQHYNYMNGRWNDGTPFTKGGNGYNTGATTNFCFPGDPCGQSEWSDVNSGHSAGDRRALGSIGKFNLPAGGNICVDLAYVFAAVDTGAGCQFDVVDSLSARMQQVQNFYNSSVTSCNAFVLGVEEFAIGSLKVYPNPAVNQVMVELPETGTYKLRLTDLNGRAVIKVEQASALQPLNVSQLPPGVYFLNAEGNAHILKAKLVIER